MKKLDNKKISIILIVTLIIVLIPYGFIIKNHIKKNKFAKNNVELYENNEDSIFKVKKIVICSSANATDKSEEQNLSNLSIYQYTDIAVYIDNDEELTEENTIKELYIDEIELIGNSDIGAKSLTYKKILYYQYSHGIIL